MRLPHGRQITAFLIALGLLAGVALPIIRKRSVDKNAHDVILLLKDISYAMEDFRQAAVLDKDQDGHGEFGSLEELVKHSSQFPKLAASFSKNRGFGRLYGYYIVVYLPRESAPRDQKKDPPTVNPRELRYAVYAWPVEFGVTGVRAWTVNQQGEIYATSNKTLRYSGLTHFPKPTAGFDTSQDYEPLNGPIGGFANVTGDGQTWTTS